MDRIRQLRKERGLSQVKLAVMADMDPATFNRLERGTGNPNLKTLERVADVLDVGVADLLEEAQAPLPPDHDADDLEAWAAGVDSIPELKRAAKSLWPLYARLAGTIGRPVPAGDAERLSEVGRKLDIINERMVELAPTPLATITERLDGPTEIHFLREPTLEERARVRAQFPAAIEVAVRQVALAY